ncbi:damage-inducible protein DinB [Bacillus haynesii]|nr:DinB family protein [Bacillus haynesii]MCY8670764.1 damage-inducible protein DinB [Bacillus haynesii]
MEKHEYEWVKQTRQILLDQCKKLNKNDFTKEFGFGFQSIRDSLVHVAGCYHAWLGSFVLSKTTSPLFTKEAINNMQIEDIQRYFQQANIYVDTVFEQFTDKFDDFIEKEPSWKMGSGAVKKTPHQLLSILLRMSFIIRGKL